MKASSIVWASVFVMSGCVVAEPNDEPEAEAVLPSTSTNPSADRPAECGDPALQAAYDVTDASVHELVTCGGMQVRLAQSLVGLLMLSNDEMLDETTREQLAAVGDIVPRNEFAMIEPGRWQIQMGSGSTFDITMYEPKGPLIVEDPFDMQSYLVGLRATYDLTFDEMLADPEAKNHWEFTWDEPGPLVHLLNGGLEVPRTFSLELSLWDIVGLVYPDWFPVDPQDLGPFTSLLELEMASEIVYVDERGSATVDYRVTTPRNDIGAIASSGGLPMKIERLSARSGARELVATHSSLAYDGGIGSLSGDVEFQSGRDIVVMDFGDGARYPEAQWLCDE